MIDPEFGWWKNWISGLFRPGQGRIESLNLRQNIPLTWEQECEEWDRKHPNGIEDCVDDHDC